ncbi:DUF6064 family protein [Bradyrhizobium liaoningense]|uniref:DUF6064 family protein n=1 Tax=Bradyrhizobium liaoningense TaxID=43992 RepID=UPI001BA5D512|nr:DUF6064 family protein [Bradyrhizobium liaoningense]MBR0715954.1 hypothetical protein [Bradyrhizobium liaoningense]
MLPFAQDEFLAVFVAYNSAIWPAQIAAYLLGGVAVALLFRRGQLADRVIAGILAAMWLWTGIAYHALWFSQINKAAYLFASLFIAQGIYLLYAGVYRCQIRFGLRSDLATAVGVALVAYAAIIYPLIGVIVGHSYPELPMFGVTPCPVTVFTLGFFLLTTERLPRSLLVVPFAWSLIGGSAAILLHVPQDWLLLASGCIVVVLIVLRDRRAAAGVGTA